MSPIRKAFWPAAIALGFFAFLVLIGQGGALRLAEADTVEITPALGSISYSLIVVSFVDEDNTPILEGPEVDFSTDRCEFYDKDGLTQDQFEGENGATEVFTDYNPKDPDTAAAVQDYVDNLPSPDPEVSAEGDTFTLTADFGNWEAGDTVVAVLVDCSDNDIEPGIATVNWRLPTEGEDVKGDRKITVVGPPAIVTVEAEPSGGLRCGEKTRITVRVRDAAGQNVSDHTLIEAVTNLGGVLGGTGAVSSGAGPTVPVSSTVAETFDGQAIFFLLTSDSHVGPYEVVIAAGELGSVNTGVLGGLPKGLVTVSCSVPPTPVSPTQNTGTAGISPPSTGISPPSTGDAGLAEGSSATRFALIGAVAFLVAGLAVLRFGRS